MAQLMKHLLGEANPSSTNCPEHITAIRVATCATTGKFCEIKM